MIACRFQNWCGDGVHVYTNAAVTVSNSTSCNCFRGGVVASGSPSTIKITDFVAEQSQFGKAMDIEIETHHHEVEVPGHVMAKVGDATPAFGIVVAVMGVVNVMGSVGEPPAVLGKMIGGALVAAATQPVVYAAPPPVAAYPPYSAYGPPAQASVYSYPPAVPPGLCRWERYVLDGQGRALLDAYGQPIREYTIGSCQYPPY